MNRFPSVHVLIFTSVYGLQHTCMASRLKRWRETTAEVQALAADSSSSEETADMLEDYQEKKKNTT